MKYIRWFSDIGMADVPSVGGKNASLGEMYRELATQGVRVPNGFAVTAEAFRYVLDQADAWPRLHRALAGLDATDVEDLARRARVAREIVYGAALPPDLIAEIGEAYARLQAEYGEHATFAVRSSATAEDLPTASFAGQHETFLNIAGETKVLDAVRRCFASLFKDRAISYRIDNGFDHFKVFQSVGVMKMVRSDRAASGVIFTLDTESGFRDVVFITGAYGLGENVVQGTVDPDEFYVFKPTLRQGHRSVLRRKLGGKEIRMVYTQGAGRESTRNMPTAKEDQARFCISDDDVLALADASLRIEEHYSTKAGRATPMDIEWAKDGVDGEIYILQARPETVVSQRASGQVDEYRLTAKGELRVTGRAVGGKIATGKAHVITDVAAARPVSARRGSGRRHHDAGLGDGDEDRGGGRHQPGRPHLSRGDRRAGARHSGRGGLRRRHHEVADRRRGHGFVRRRRGGPRLRGRAAIHADPDRPLGTGAAAAPTSWSISAIPTWRSRPPCSRPTASGWRAWSSSLPSTSRRIRWRWCIRRRSTIRRSEMPSRA